MLLGFVIGIWLFVVVTVYIAQFPLLLLLFGQIEFGTCALYTLTE